MAALRLLFTRGGQPARVRVADMVFTPRNSEGRALVEELANRWWEDREFDTHFSEMEMARFFVWLEREYPAAEDPDDRDGRGMDTREGIVSMKNRLVKTLVERGTHDAVDALQHALGAHPTLTYLRRLKRTAEEQALATGWRSPSIGELLQLAEHSTMRFVETTEDLCRAIVESLARFQTQLNGEDTPMAEFLWDSWPGRAKGAPRFKPKDETSLSNLIKRHLKSELDERGIIVNREVEVSRPAGTGVGQRTDIHVNAKPAKARSGSTLTVVVEVKKCENRERKTAIRAQLVDRYLKPIGERNGVLVVGHFDCAAYSCCKGETRASIWAMLLSQAQAVAPDFIIEPVVLDTSLPASMLPKKALIKEEGKVRRAASTVSAARKTSERIGAKSARSKSPGKRPDKMAGGRSRGAKR